FVFVIPLDKEVDMKKAAKAVGEKSVEMIHVKDIKDVTGYIRGGCTPIGMKKQFRTVIHNSVLDFDEVIVSGGMIGAQIFIKPSDLIKVTGAKTEDIIFS
ncbi:MAG: YbaK/EbsC family protein, partial [Acutalibacteraceae bacterium]